MDALRSELTCSKCNQLFNQPVTLPCLHSACCACVDSIVKEAVEILSNGGVGDEKTDCGSEKENASGGVG